MNGMGSGMVEATPNLGASRHNGTVGVGLTATGSAEQSTAQRSDVYPQLTPTRRGREKSAVRVVGKEKIEVEARQMQ
eukprot:4789282-Karenia_brevis.AAC.1